MKAFIDDHRQVYGVEPICKVLPLPRRPTTSMWPGKSSLHGSQPEHAGMNCSASMFSVSGTKIFRSMARCTVERLMRRLGLQGVVRGKTPRTTVSDRVTPCPRDHVNRQFQASRPNAFWVSDRTSDGKNLPGIGGVWQYVA
ncbi:hypothetical protein FCG41_04805 [Azotobacter chroococcum]|nr:hypothetical protein [Azotobacter chroococcum]TKD45161.1 hypothetical protein FCG41_04805 [Azotobacter chroococcum]